MYASPEGFSAETELSDYAIYECAYSGTTPLLPFLEFSFVLEIGKKKSLQELFHLLELQDSDLFASGMSFRGEKQLHNST